MDGISNSSFMDLKKCFSKLSTLILLTISGCNLRNPSNTLNTSKDPKELVYESLFEYIKNSFQHISGNDDDSQYYQTKVNSNNFNELILKARIDTSNDKENIFTFITDNNLNDYDIKLVLDIFDIQSFSFYLNGNITYHINSSTYAFSSNIDKENFNKTYNQQFDVSPDGLDPFKIDEITSIVIDEVDLLFTELNYVFEINNLSISMKGFGLKHY